MVGGLNEIGAGLGLRRGEQRGEKKGEAAPGTQKQRGLGARVGEGPGRPLERGASSPAGSGGSDRCVVHQSGDPLSPSRGTRRGAQKDRRTEPVWGQTRRQRLGQGFPATRRPLPRLL